MTGQETFLMEIINSRPGIEGLHCSASLVCHAEIALCAICEWSTSQAAAIRNQTKSTASEIENWRIHVLWQIGQLWSTMQLFLIDHTGSWTVIHHAGSWTLLQAMPFWAC